MYIPPRSIGIGAGYAELLGKQDDKVSQWSSLIGIVTAIVGNVLISFALNIQRYAHIRIDEEHARHRQQRKARKKLPRALRNYGTAVQQNEVAEERARLNATAPGLGAEVDDSDSSDAGETSPLNRSIHSDTTEVQSGQEDKSSRKSYLKSPYWWFGITLMTVGEAGNFLAYGFAPASIVSPLGVVALISNCLIAPLMLKEHFRKRDFWGVLVAIGGAVTIVLSARTSEAKMGPDKLWHTIKRWEFLTYVCITLVFIVVLMVLSPRYGRRTILIDLGLVGLFGGYTALSTKGVAAMLSDSLFRAFAYPITYVMVLVLILSAIMQIRYINRALSNFNSTQVIPTQFVLFTLSVIIGSAVLYRDFEKADLEHVIKFVSGCILTFSGVWLITSGRKNGHRDEDDDEEEEGNRQEEAIRLIDEEQNHQKQDQTKREHSEITDVHHNLSAIGQTSNNVDGSSGDSAPSLSFKHQSSIDSIESEIGTSAKDRKVMQARPKTPRQFSELSTNSDGTPFFTPSSAPGTSIRPNPLHHNISDSALVTPITPTRPTNFSSSRPEIVLPDGQIVETPPSTLFRSARGSIRRLIPGPLIPPLSGSLNTIVADSLRRGEGSPRFFRDSVRRRRSERGRRTPPPIDSTVPRSAIESPSVIRWPTREDVPDTPRSTTSELTPSAEDRIVKRRRSRLGSFGDTLTDFFKKARQSDRDGERQPDRSNQDRSSSGDDRFAPR